jgi:PhnB protein
MSVTPYLAVADAAAAIRFYTDALGAVEKFRLPSDDGKKIMHAELELAGGTIFLSDMGPERKPTGISVALGFEKANEVDRVAASLAAHGSTINTGPEDAFWGDRFAEVTDPFGHCWPLTAPKD